MSGGVTLVRNAQQKAAVAGGFLRKLRRLMQLSRDAGELFVERGAQPVDHGDDRNRNASSNKAIFDRGGAVLIFY
jgi:hypothetical protein